jgi:hypothetical protein
MYKVTRRAERARAGRVKVCENELDGREHAFGLSAETSEEERIDAMAHVTK